MCMLLRLGFSWEVVEVIDAARAEGLKAAAVPRLVAVVRQLGGPLRALVKIREEVHAWESYLAHLQAEVDHVLAAMRIEASMEAAQEMCRMATLGLRAGLEPVGVRHITNADELRRQLAHLGIGSSHGLDGAMTVPGEGINA